jgi:hypothetical protein
VDGQVTTSEDLFKKRSSPDASIINRQCPV